MPARNCFSNRLFPASDLAGKGQGSFLSLFCPSKKKIKYISHYLGCVNISFTSPSFLPHWGGWEADFALLNSLPFEAAAKNDFFFLTKPIEGTNSTPNKALGLTFTFGVCFLVFLISR